MMVLGEADIRHEASPSYYKVAAQLLQKFEFCIVLNVPEARAGT